MGKYGISIHGTGYDLLDEHGLQIKGFYISVFVEANDFDEAAQKAINFFVESEAYTTVFPPDQHPDGILQIEAVDELYSFENVPYPVSGFSFYGKDDLSET